MLADPSFFFGDVNGTVEVMPVNAEAETAALQIVAMLRRRGVTADMAYKGNLKKRLQKANARGATLAVMVDKEQWARRVVDVKILRTGEQISVTDDPESGLDVDDEIYALTLSAHVGIDRSNVAVEPGGELGFYGNEAAEPE
jgi:histidyl-tRNA synthetase